MLIEIDYEKCIKCSNCVKACPAVVFKMEENGPIVKSPEVCINCGHCIAICPTDAVSHEQLNFEDFTKIENPNIAYSQLNNLIKNRRSTRNYKEKLITEDHIKQILDSVNYIPTGENNQELRYKVIQNKEILDDIRKEMRKKFQFLYNIANLPIIKHFVPEKERNGLENLVRRSKMGLDPFLRGAPCFIIIYAKNKNRLTQWDAGIATYNIALTAETLGIGTVINGFHTLSASVFGKIKKASKIDKGIKIVASICLGYPKLKYRKICGRNPLRYEILN